MRKRERLFTSLSQGRNPADPERAPRPVRPGIPESLRQRRIPRRRVPGWAPVEEEREQDDLELPFKKKMQYFGWEI